MPESSADPVARRLLWVVLAVALVVRVGWALRQPTDRVALETLPDQREYVALADTLADGQPMSFVDPRFGETVYAYRTPGYPAFLAATGVNLRAARVAQGVIDTSTVLAAYLLARRWLVARRAVVAAGLVAVNPFLIYFCGLLLTETLFTAALAWAAVGLAWSTAWVGARGWSPGAAAAVALTVGAMARPSGLLLLVVLPLLAPARWPRRVGLALVGVVVGGLAFAPWAARNARVVGRPVVTTTNGGITFYDGFNPMTFNKGVTFTDRLRNGAGGSDQSFTQTMPELREMDEVQRSDYLESLAWRFTRERPADAAQLGVLKLLRTWSPVPLSAEFGRTSYRAIGLVYALPLYALVLVGLWRGLRRGVGRGRLERKVVAFLIGPAIYFSVLHVMSVGSMRYRVPAEPLLCVIAASAWPGRSARSDG